VRKKGDQKFGLVYAESRQVYTAARTTTQTLDTVQRCHSRHFLQVWHVPLHKEPGNVCPNLRGRFVINIESKGRRQLTVTVLRAFADAAAIFNFGMVFFCLYARSSCAPVPQIKYWRAHRPRLAAFATEKHFHSPSGVLCTKVRFHTASKAAIPHIPLNHCGRSNRPLLQAATNGHVG